MIDKLIASDLAVLAREDQQQIPAFALPVPRARPRRHALIWAGFAAAAPTLAMLAVGVVFVELDVAPFSNYEAFLAPFVVAIASLVGLATEGRSETSLARSRRQASYVLAGGVLVAAMVTCFVIGWPGEGGAWLQVSYDAVYAVIGGESPALTTRVGFISILATLAFVLARLIAGKLDPQRLTSRRNLDAWGTAGLVAGVLVIVLWAGAMFFAARYWPLVDFRLPDPTLRDHYAAAIKGSMWLALRFRPWSESSISIEQWDAFAAAAGVIVVAIASCIAIARERQRGRTSRWLQLVELPVVVPLFVIVGMRYLVAAMVADGPDQAASPFAIASAAVMLAFTSMILRRRRRRALS